MVESRNSIVKNQHYVPQRYLHKFAVKSSKKNNNIYRFNIFDKEKTEVRINQNVENYASERFFYDIDFEQILEEVNGEGIAIDPIIEHLTIGLDKQSLEKLFANRVETKMFIPFENIITAYTLTQKDFYPKSFVIPEESRATVAYYIAIQYVRTKEYREKMIQIYEKLPKLMLKKKFGSELDPEILKNIEIKLKESRINLLHNQILFDSELLESLSLTFLQHIWFIAVNESNTQFYTSDNPLVFYGHEDSQGMSSRGIEIVFPITPKLALIMREVEYFESDLELYNKFVVVSEEYVQFCNELQVAQSYRYIFSKDSNFMNTSSLIEKFPELKNINRDRFLGF